MSKPTNPPVRPFGLISFLIHAMETNSAVVISSAYGGHFIGQHIEFIDNSGQYPSVLIKDESGRGTVVVIAHIFSVALYEPSGITVSDGVHKDVPLG